MTLKYLKNVTTLEYNPERCTGCGRCAEVCPHAVFSIPKDQKKAQIYDRDLCIECGACMRNCPFEAIRVRPGVGCAYAILLSSIRGRKTVCCG